MSHYQNFEPPFEIPDSWEWVKLGEIGLWQSGATPSKSNPNYFGTGYPWLNTGVLNDGYISSIPKEITQLALKETSVKLNPVGSVLIAMYGATIGKLGILNIEATTNQACCACYKYWINQKYLFFFLLAWRPQFIQMGGGGAQPNISKEKIEATHIPCPPINEQLRIVRQIEFIFELLDKLDINGNDIGKTIDNTKSKILELAMEGKLVPQNPTDEPAADMLRRINPMAKIITDNPHSWNIPETWCWCQLGDLFNHNTGKALNSSNQDGQEYEYITTSNVYWDRFELDSLKKMFYKDSEIDKCKVVKGDLLVCEGGDVGRSAIWNMDFPIMIQNHLHRLRPVSEGILASLYLYLFRLYKEKELIGGKGIALQGFSSNTLHKLVVPCIPKNEQKRIVAKIEKLYSVLDKIEASLQS